MLHSILGRAGRDQQLSTCYLYFCYKDISRLSRIIFESDNKTPETFKTHMNNLNDVVYFCTNNVECRRAQVLRYFGENFDARDCAKEKNSICDNCAQGVSI